MDTENLLNPAELSALADKVKKGEATNEEIITYLDTVNGLLGEFLEALKAAPVAEEK